MEARIPYTFTIRKCFAVASEVATVAYPVSLGCLYPRYTDIRLRRTTWQRLSLFLWDSQKALTRATCGLV